MRKIEGLDGLRAVFVISVLFFHILLVFYPENLDYFYGGFLGVESFFVLSGFLITYSLLHKYVNDNYLSALLQFLKGRYLRLFPAFVFLILIQIFVINLLFPDLGVKFLSEVLYGSFNVYNWWLIFRNVPYFEKFSETLFNLHFWSLSIEWQFYVIWALVFLFLIKFNRVILNLFILISIFLSSADMYILYNLFHDMDRVYFGTDTRFFSFLIGSFIALNIDKIPKKDKTFFVVGFVGITLLFIGYFILNSYEDYMYPLGFLFVSILTAGIIVSVLKSCYFNKYLSIFPLKWIGERSYSIYLWHYPIFVMLNLIYSNNQLIVITIGIILTVFISNISYIMIEEPFRKLDFSQVLNIKSASNLLLSLTILGLSVGYLSVLQPEKRDYEKAVSIELDDNKVSSYEVKLYPEKDNIEKVEENQEESKDIITEEDNKSLNSEIFIIGDSVILGASNYIKKYIPNAYIDAKVGRQFNEVESIINDEKVKSCKKVIIALGNNGYIKRSELENILDKLQNKEVYLVTVKVPKPWQNEVNNLFKQAASERSNVHVVDWYSVSKDKEDMFVKDKVHLNSKGAKLYVSLIKNHLLERSNPSKKTVDVNIEEKTTDVENIELKSE